MPAIRTVFMFSGQGSQYYRMGSELFEKNDVFRQWMIRLDGLAQKLSGQRVLDAIYSGAMADAFDHTLLTHPAIFIIEYSLAQCLIHQGITPDMTLGASLGSFAAATVAGCIEVDEALSAVVRQATVFEASCEPGGMIAILSDPALFAEPFLSERSELAGVNFASHFIVSARHKDLNAIEAELLRRNITHQKLAVSFAFHSRWIEAAQAPFATFMRSIRCVQGKLPLVCCDHAESLSQLPEGFFWRIARQPIRFRETIARLEQSGPYRYVDVGPSGTLATFVKYGLPAASRSTAHAVLTPYGQDVKNLTALSSVMARQ